MKKLDTKISQALNDERHSITSVSRASRAFAPAFNKTCIFVSRLSIIANGDKQGNAVLPTAWEAECIVAVLNKTRIRETPYTLEEFYWHLI